MYGDERKLFGNPDAYGGGGRGSFKDDDDDDFFGNIDSDNDNVDREYSSFVNSDGTLQITELITSYEKGFSKYRDSYETNANSVQYKELIKFFNYINREAKSVGLVERIDVPYIYQSNKKDLRDIVKYNNGSAYYVELESGSLYHLLKGKIFPKSSKSYPVYTNLFEIPQDEIVEIFGANPLVWSLYLREHLAYIVETIHDNFEYVSEFNDEIQFFKENENMLTLKNCYPHLHDNCKGQLLGQNEIKLPTDENANNKIFRLSKDRGNKSFSCEAEIDYNKETITINNNSKTNKMNTSNLFKGLRVGKIGGVALTMDGKLAVNSNGSYFSYDVETNTLTDNMDMSFGEDMGIFYTVPTNKNDVKAGDIIIDNNDMVFVKKAVKGAFTVISPSENEEVKKVKCKNLFGIDFVSKVVSLMDTASFSGNGDSSNALGGMNPMMLMMMNDNDGDDFGGGNSSMKDMLPLMLMQNQGQNGQAMNPMMMMMMMKDDGNSSMKDMMMMSMMMGGNNPFAQTQKSED